MLSKENISQQQINNPVSQFSKINHFHDDNDSSSESDSSLDEDSYSRI